DVSFDRPILGLALRDSTLNSTDLLGTPGTNYPTSGRGFDAFDSTHPDFVTIANDRRSISFNLQTSPDSDDIRIITEPAGSNQWHNYLRLTDVDDNGTVTPLDALVIINELNANGSHTLLNPPIAPSNPPPYFDVNNDSIVSALDALNVINDLNSTIQAA